MGNWWSGVKTRAGLLAKDPIAFLGSAAQDVFLNPEEARKARLDMMNGNYNSPEAQKLSNIALSALTVYHGSPHKFDKFDKRKIGTGEGAQAYGHGMYFSENPNVADSYYNQFHDTHGAAHFYKADIPDELIPKMLDWDKPLSQQPESVRKALQKLGPEADSAIAKAASESLLPSFKSVAEILDPRSEKYASDFIGMLNRGTNPDRVSAMLNAQGIPGIRYLDAGSRSGGKGSYNYVVFDPESVKILERQ